jgi:hypothetical protein
MVFIPSDERSMLRTKDFLGIASASGLNNLQRSTNLAIWGRKVSTKRATMGNLGRRRNTAQPVRDAREDGFEPARSSSAVEENVQTIKRWERAILLARSKAEQVSDWIACNAASG